MFRIERENIVNNFIIDFYLDSFNRRLRNRESKTRIGISYMFSVFYCLLIIKYGLNLFIDFDYETRLILFDLSLFFGGLEK